MFERVPNSLKMTLLIGVLAIGPAMVFAFVFGGTTAAIGVVLAIIVFFTVVYIVGVRKYM
jgi:hypothetical protein